ncbi:glycosyltransferase [Asaccharospora irregularis]|uniref:Glycosyltransferase involved in cell wall bisynthesis n=1 Tax=Asaccharospora irregularis DSM 2635 TaxID=1121321 RepID=A0A1M5SQ55_9FIRM|nr:glycosyltransferase [Asaccharospora irregularis]SHH40625.1 Glycosyltransferase involved in cell wall bisynthesis [Asaccharospora irregularis DSM 2635]
MLLSIVMMMKNEEEHLDRTLSALKPLINDINSELIILDTGSTDKSVEIAKRYTDNLYFAKWNDNFADMRNLSISYSSGDWILIIDADEELISYERMIEFFNSNLYKNYNCASIELKNIMCEDGDTYDKASVPRLFRNEDSFRYEGAIHEQPIYRNPLYNNIASFNHYGYMFSDEEIKQKKLKRNEAILMSEINKSPEDPYIYYQLGRNYTALGEKEEALSYIEKAHDMYKKKGLNYIPVKSDLASLYIELGYYDKCSKVCLNYIEKDDKNIDIYYYLAVSQEYLRRYEESLKNYKRYIFLMENYELSSQANNVYCMAETVSFKETVEIKIIELYYKLEMYEQVINETKDYEIDKLKKVYSVVFFSLYKLNREEEILEIYNKTSSSDIEKKYFKKRIEDMILAVKKSDRVRIYKVLSKIDGNYGTLNQVRLGKTLACKEYNEILLGEKEEFYSDLIYYGLKQEIDLLDMLSGISNIQVNNYLYYLIVRRRDCIIDLYNYLIDLPSTLELKKLSIYMSLSKYLLLNGGLKGEKYKNLFLMYIKYSYDYIKQVYNENFTDEELLEVVSMEDDIFIISINIIQKLKNDNKLEYIKKMRTLLKNNPNYKQGIEILIDMLKRELDESDELKKLKVDYKKFIENSINTGNIQEAKNMIEEYEGIYEEDVEILNMKSIIEMINNNFSAAEKLLRKSVLLDPNNYNTNFNIAYLKESTGQLEDAIKFYKNVLMNCKDEGTILEINNRINSICKK